MERNAMHDKLEVGNRIMIKTTIRAVERIRKTRSLHDGSLDFIFVYNEAFSYNRFEHGRCDKWGYPMMRKKKHGRGKLFDNSDEVFLYSWQFVHTITYAFLAFLDC